MARLVQKSGYIKNGKASGYMEYVATRDGVEIINSTEPVTKKQEQFIKRLLKDFPDAKELFEYSDYLQTPNRGTASAFIAVALDTHLHEVESESGYMSYIAQRPRAEKHGGHGLFSEVDTTDLKAAKAELKAHGGKVWTFIFSLRREDAERLGYNKAAAWQNLLKQESAAIAEAMRIRTDDFRWYAAYHDEGHHPHVHMMVWSTEPEKGYLTREGIALEQVICFDSNIDAEKFAKEKTAIFLVLPEEDRTKNFMAGLMIQNLSKELFELAEKGKGRLPNRVVFFCDEFGTMPAFDVEALFSAGRSRGITLVPIIQSLAQVEKNYGREGAEILTDNCQDTIFGGFAPNSQTAEQLSKSLGSRTVLSGSVSKGKNDPSQSLQMMERPLMTPDELKSIPKGSFVVMKTGTHPMQTKLRLFLDWGITFDATYATSEHAARPVAYASRQELFLSISKRYSSSDQPAQAQQASTTQRRAPRSAMGLYSEDTRP